MNLINSFSNFRKNFDKKNIFLNILTQLGGDIYGESSSDQSGFSVSMNDSGDRVAIGAPYNNGLSGSDRGHVRVYSWNGSAWNQLGGDIDGESSGDRSGWSVSMNSAGNIVAIGAPYNDATPSSVTDSGHVRVYSWNGSAWNQLGIEIKLLYSNVLSGYSVSMNAAGNIVAIGAILYGSSPQFMGMVSIYYWDGSAWNQLGGDIYGESSGDQSGRSVSMNAAGDRVAIGAIYNNGLSGSDRGHVRVYSWNGSAWNQLGGDIDGEEEGDFFGWSVSMNAAGDRMAIGAIYAYNNAGVYGDRYGHVRVYSWNGSAWNQLGGDIDGEAAVDSNGFSVSMNAVGDRVVVGAINNDSSGLNSGQVRIYSWDGSSWTQLATDINGLVGDQSGYSVSMNAAGDRIAIGAIFNDGAVPNSNVGNVRVYSLQ